MKVYIDKLKDGDLSYKDSRAAVVYLLDRATPVETHDFLIALNQKEIAVSELAGFAQGMKDRAEGITLNMGKFLANYAKSNIFASYDPSTIKIADTCGTGGSKTNNIGTGSMPIISGAGVPVAKHGNNAVTSNSGSADVLQELGVNIMLTPAQSQEVMEEVGCVFLYARTFHPLMKNVAAIRKKIKEERGEGTIFNLVGPLANPANVGAQLVGVYDKRLCKKFPQALDQLGIEKALVVHSQGLDEISNIGETVVYELNKGEVHDYTIHPSDFGFKVYTKEDISGATVQENAKYIRDALNGVKGPMRDVYLMTAGAILYAAGRAKTIKEGVEIAIETVDSGAAAGQLEKLVACSNKFLTKPS